MVIHLRALDGQTGHSKWALNGSGVDLYFETFAISSNGILAAESNRGLVLWNVSSSVQSSNFSLIPLPGYFHWLSFYSVDDQDFNRTLLERAYYYNVTAKELAYVDIQTGRPRNLIELTASPAFPPVIGEVLGGGLLAFERLRNS